MTDIKQFLTTCEFEEVLGRKPDYKRGKTKGEVKNWKRAVDSGVIREASKKKVKEIVSKSGFTKQQKI